MLQSQTLAVFRDPFFLVTGYQLLVTGFLVIEPVCSKLILLLFSVTRSF